MRIVWGGSREESGGGREEVGGNGRKGREGKGGEGRGGRCKVKDYAVSYNGTTEESCQIRH